MSGHSLLRRAAAAIRAGKTTEAEENLRLALECTQQGLRDTPQDAGPWWDMGMILAMAGQWPHAQRSFLASLELRLTQTEQDVATLVINTEKRFLGHEFPVFEALVARGEEAFYLTSCPETLQSLLQRDSFPWYRVLLLGPTHDESVRSHIDFNKVGVMFTASVKPNLICPDTVSTVFLTHDLMGFERTDLPTFQSQDADARLVLSAYSSFDYYVTGTEAAAVDLAHRVAHYAPSIPSGLARGARPPERVIVPAGYPRLDTTIAEMNYSSNVGLDTILLAPTEQGVNPGTWSLEEVRLLLEQLTEKFPRHRIVLRPHPSDLDRYPAEYSRLAERMRATENFRFDTDVACREWPRTATLVTDTSGTAYTFALSSQRPVIYFSPRESALVAQYPDSAALRHRCDIGYVVEDLAALVSTIATIVEGAEGRSLPNRRLDLVPNLGCSAARLADAIGTIRERGVEREWRPIEVGAPAV